MDPSSDVAQDFDLLLGGAAPARDSAHHDSTLFDSAPLNAALAPAPLAPPAAASAAAGASSDADAASGGAASQSASRKRPLDDKKAREKKRILRNRELARVSNERRKGRIKAMEHELEDTRKTVSNLEESIRTLEAENNDLKTLLESKSSVLRP